MQTSASCLILILSFTLPLSSHAGSMLSNPKGESQLYRMSETVKALRSEKAHVNASEATANRIPIATGAREASGFIESFDGWKTGTVDAVVRTENHGVSTFRLQVPETPVEGRSQFLLTEGRTIGNRPDGTLRVEREIKKDSVGIYQEAYHLTAKDINGQVWRSVQKFEATISNGHTTVMVGKVSVQRPTNEAAVLSARTVDRNDQNLHHLKMPLKDIKGEVIDCRVARLSDRSEMTVISVQDGLAYKTTVQFGPGLEKAGSESKTVVKVSDPLPAFEVQKLGLKAISSEVFFPANQSTAARGLQVSSGAH